MPRQKAAPQMINTDTYVPSQAFSQDPFAPSQQQQWGDNPSGTQLTSTPIYSRNSQPLFDTSAQLFDTYVSSQAFSQDPFAPSQQQQWGDNPSGTQLTSTPIYSRNSHPLFDTSAQLSPIHSVSRGRVQKKTKKRNAGTNVDREIKRLQNTTHNLLKVAPFARLVKETITKMSGGKTFRVQSDAVTALMQASEAYLITLFEASYMCTNHAKRVTLKADDMQLVRRILAAFGM